MTLAIDGRRAAPQGTVHAAGALVWRERRGRLEVALVHRPRYRDWSWPKGKLDPGEAVPAAAVREVAEELGTPVVLGVPLPALRYRTPEGRSKHVRYWAARGGTAVDGPALAARAPVAPAGLDEIDDVVWVSVPTAADLLTRRADRSPLAALVDLHRRGRLVTRPLTVVRHAQAVKRDAWDGDDASRPLTPDGRDQAAALGPVLAAFGTTAVVTSPWRRCVETVEPYRAAGDVGVEQVEALSQGAHREDPAPVAALVEKLVDEAATDPLAGGSTAVCTHRPVLPTVLTPLARASRRWTAGQLPKGNPWLRPGEVVVAHVDAERRVVAVERHRPPAAGAED